MKFTSLEKVELQPISHNPEIRKKVMVRSGEIPHLTNFSQSYFAPGQSAIAHAHPDMCEIFFVESGSGVIRINGVDYPLEPGNCVVVEPQEIHEVINTGSMEMVLTYFGVAV